MTKVDYLEVVEGLERVLNSVNNVNQKNLEVGWFEQPEHPHREGVPVAQIAYWQEFGNASNQFYHIPRPFMRPAIVNNKQMWINILYTELLSNFKSQKHLLGAFHTLGDTVRKDIKKSIESDHPKLKKLTLALRHLRTDRGIKLSHRIIRLVDVAIKKGATSYGQLGFPSNNTTPLQDTYTMIDSVDYRITDA